MKGLTALLHRLLRRLVLIADDGFLSVLWRAYPVCPLPALPPVPGVIQARFIGTDASDVNLGSTLHIKYAGAAPTISQLQTFATAIGTAWASQMAPITDTGFTLTKIECADLSSSTAAVAEVPVSHPGTRAGVALPLNVAFTLQELTQLRRRGGHWHIQLRAGVQADLASPQDWAPAFVSDVINAANAWLGLIAGDGWPGAGQITFVGVQYYGPPNRTITGSTGRVRTVSTLLEVPQTYTVTGLNANTRLGSQRRRLGKSGG